LLLASARTLRAAFGRRSRSTRFDSFVAQDDNQGGGALEEIESGSPDVGYPFN
jgi:hypothetical protein